MNSLANISLGFMLATTCVSAFGILGFGGNNWKEEVLLHDGSKIIVTRAVKRGGRHEIGQRPSFIEQSLSFVLPSTNERVTWEDRVSKDLGNSSFNPMLLEVFGDTAYVLSSPAGCLSYNKWGRPNPPYVVFKYQNKDWKRIPLQELPVEIKLPNLVISSPDDVAKKAGYGVLSVEMIKHENEGFGQPEFRAILREAIPGGGQGRCPEMIRTGDGWISTDWFSSQKSYESCMNVCEREKVMTENCPCIGLFKGK